MRSAASDLLQVFVRCVSLINASGSVAVTMWYYKKKLDLQG
uniref:Uncharacterized protein n=1 Tax=Arundo donax TaxID=35708 RepID=A0A0A9H9G2_ARUDO